MASKIKVAVIGCGTIAYSAHIPSYMKNAECEIKHFCDIIPERADAAVKKYSLRQTMRVISLLNDYDFKGKGGEVGEATPADLLVELTTKILNI